LVTTPNKSFSKFADLSWRIFIRNIRAAHRKSILGMVWVVIPPLVNAAVWVLLNANGVIQFEGMGGVSYAIFALSGILLWQIFLDALQIPFNTMMTFEPIIKSLYFKRSSILGATTLEVVFNAAIRVLILIVGLLIYQVSAGFGSLLFVLPMLVLMLLGFGISLWLMPLFLLYKDVNRLLGFATQFAFFLTPIVYQLPDPNTWFGKIAYWNPVTPPLLAARDLVLTGQTEHWSGVGFVFLLTLILVVSGWRLFRVTCERIIERI